MARRAQSLTKLLIIISAALSFSGADIYNSNDIILKNERDKDLHRLNGYLYYKDKLFSGKTFDLYEQCDTSILTEYKSGKENGKQILYYRDGSINEERSYFYGRKEGLHQGWWENGNKRFEYQFENDKYNGEQKEWNEAGLLYNDFNYKDGYEEGLQRSWYPDGKIQANYIVRNGRKYGLTGVMNCVSE
jgi:antitoxin component YwqK of YwqJK toxin-antitoxin module